MQLDAVSRSLFVRCYLKVTWSTFGQCKGEVTGHQIINLICLMMEYWVIVILYTANHHLMKSSLWSYHRLCHQDLSYKIFQTIMSNYYCDLLRKPKC